MVPDWPGSSASPYKKIGTFCATECGTEGFSVVQVGLSSGLKS